MHPFSSFRHLFRAIITSIFVLAFGLQSARAVEDTVAGFLGVGNLAFGAQVTASSIQPERQIPPAADPTLNRIETFSPANALDGSNGSRWMAGETDSHAWYQLDFDKVRRIARTEIYFVKPTRGHTCRLESSTDGVN